MSDVEKLAAPANGGETTPTEKPSLDKSHDHIGDEAQTSNPLRGGFKSTWTQLTQSKGVDIGASLFAEIENYSQEELEAEKDIVRRKIDWHIMPIVRLHAASFRLPLSFEIQRR